MTVDGLETVKNKGRQDVYDIWKIEAWKISQSRKSGRNELNIHIRTNFIVRLLMDKTGQPDWAYMEEYMRKVEERVKVMMGKYEMTVNEAAL